MIFISPRLLTVVGKGRLEGVKATPVFLFKMVAVIAAFAVQLGILIKVISKSDLYGSSSILSTVLYLVGLVCISLPFLSAGQHNVLNFPMALHPALCVI